MSYRRKIVVVCLLCLLLPSTIVAWVWLDSMGAEFYLTYGMSKEKVVQNYGMPDLQDEHSMTFWQGGHDVHLTFRSGVVTDVQIAQCD